MKNESCGSSNCLNLGSVFSTMALASSIPTLFPPMRPVPIILFLIFIKSARLKYFLARFKMRSSREITIFTIC